MAPKVHHILYVCLWTSHLTFNILSTTRSVDSRCLWPFFPLIEGFLMILSRIKPWWKRTSLWLRGVLCLTNKSIKMTFLMMGFFGTLEQQWYYCHSTISFQEPELHISPKNAFIGVEKHSFVRLTRRRFSIKTSKCSEGHFLGVKTVAAGSVGNSHQHFFPLTFAILQKPKNTSLFPSDLLGP